MSGKRDASAVLLLRGSGSSLEVYLVERSPKLRFFGGYLALPGGVLDASDAPGEEHDARLRTCGVRELFEETGVLLAESDADSEQRVAARRALLDGDTAPYATLIAGSPGPSADMDLCRIRTPPFAPVRYDTLFVVTQLPPDQEPEIWPGELVGGRFWKPVEALEAWRRGAALIVPPVLILLELMVDADVAAFRESAARIAQSYHDGELHRVRFSPGVIMASLVTPTLPPATTTNCLIIGDEELHFVDPASPDPGEQARLFGLVEQLQAEGHALGSILLTHHHPDHVGAAAALSERFGLAVRGHELTLSRVTGLPHVGPPIADGDTIALGTAPDGSPDWHLRALHTPGHDRGHLCFHESRYGALVAGDMISTVSTIIIDPPEGHMPTYMQSLERLAGLEITTLYPAHGPAVRNGNAVVQKFIAHRTQRQQKLVDELQRAPSSEEELLPRVYADVDERMYPFAARSLLAGLQWLEEEGRARTEDNVWTYTG